MQSKNKPSWQTVDSALPRPSFATGRILQSMVGLSARPVSFWFLPWLILLVSLLVTAWATINSKNSVRINAEDYFNARVQSISEQINFNLILYKQSLFGARALFDINGQVSRNQFKHYVDDLRLEMNYPGIQGLGYSLIISPQKLDEHILAMRKQGFSTYGVYPLGKRALYTTIIYLEPFDWRNQRAFGYDMYSESIRRSAMEQARDSNEPAMSGKVILVQETRQDVQNGFLMYLPVYRQGLPHDTPSSRRKNMMGWVYEVFRMGKLFEGISIAGNRDIDVHVYDGDRISDAALMFDNDKIDKRQARLKSTRHLVIAQHEWTLEFQSTPFMERQFDFMLPVKIASAGTALSLLVFILSWVLLNGAKRSARTALLLNKELIDSEEILRKERAYLHTLIKNASDGIHVLDQDGQLIETSDSFCRMLGYSRDEMLGMHVSQWDALHTHSEEQASVLKKQLENHECTQFETKYRRKDGAIRDIEISCVPFEVEGRPTLFSSSRDITERKVLETSLQNERSLNASILKLAGPIILVIDQNGSIVSFNRTAEELTGYRFEEIRDKPYFWKQFLLLEERSKVEAEFASALSGKITSQIENYWVDANDRSRLISWSNTILTDEDGKFHLLIAIGIDITERRYAEEELKASELRLKEILNLSPISVRISTQEGRRVLFCNKSYANLIQSSNPIEENPKNYYLYPEEYDQILQELARGKNVIDRQIQLDVRGDTVWVLASYMSLRYMNAPAILGWFYDISELKKSERALTIAATAFESQEGTVITDADANILQVNHAFTEITGYSAQDIIGSNMRMLQSGRMDANFYQSMWHSIHENGYWSGEIWNKRKNGEIFPEQLTITAVKDEEHRVTNYVGSLLDITDRKITEAQIQQLAYYDDLTGLPNRRLFRDRLEQDLKRAMRKNASLALLFIDLDRFKEVNDTLGHEKGDVLLIETARRVRQHVRDTDTFARLGGDEFAITLPEFGERSSIDRVVQNVVRDLAVPFDLGDGDVGYISGSVGIALYPQDATNIEDLLKHADQAMYAAKQGGRNGLSYFTHSMEQKTQEKISLTNDLRLALQKNQLEVYFQPIVDADKGKIVKAEALLRWHHPVHGMILPGVFIPLAEESELILEIGEWVFEATLKNIMRWKARTGRLIQVSVNKSPIQFLRAEFHPWLESYLKSGLPSKSITVEITEGLLLSESEKAKQDFIKFRKHEIELSIDDFGTGFSALSYLNRFDVDYLKIDKSFVQKMTTNFSSRSLTEAIILMAHKLGIRTIAEGVETEAQRDLLKSFGCDYLQGYLFSKPVPSDTFENLIAG